MIKLHLKLSGSIEVHFAKYTGQMFGLLHLIASRCTCPACQQSERAIRAERVRPAHDIIGVAPGPCEDFGCPTCAGAWIMSNYLGTEFLPLCKKNRVYLQLLHQS
jgi:hypothetical protein